MFSRARKLGVLALSGLAVVAATGGLLGDRQLAEGAVLAAPSKTFGTGLAIVNLSDANAANITIQAFSVPSGAPPTGWPASGVSAQIAPAGTKGYFSPNTSDDVFKNIPAGSLVSFVISADQPIAATVNLQRVGNSDEGGLPGSTTNPFRVATSAGISDQITSQVVYASQVPKNTPFNSKVYIQNTAGSAANVAITVFDGTGATVFGPSNQSINAYTSYEFDPAATASIPNGNLSLKADSGDPTKKLALTVNFFNTAGDAATSQFLSYNGSGTGSLKLYAPAVVGNYFGFNSGVAAQNIGTGATNIRFTYTFAGQTYSQTFENVGPGQSKGAYFGAPSQVPQVADLLAKLAPGGGGVTGAAVIESLPPTSGGAAQPLIGNVNQDKRDDPQGIGGIGSGDTYRMFRDEEATTKAALPQVTKKQTNSDLTTLNAGFVSGVLFQVIGGPATCNITFSGSNLTSPVSKSYAVDANSNVSIFLASLAELPDGFGGAAQVDCGATRVFAVANLAARQLTNPGNVAGVGDSLTFSLSIPK